MRIKWTSKKGKAGLYEWWKHTIGGGKKKENVHGQGKKYKGTWKEKRRVGFICTCQGHKHIQSLCLEGIGTILVSVCVFVCDGWLFIFMYSVIRVLTMPTPKLTLIFFQKSQTCGYQYTALHCKTGAKNQYKSPEWLVTKATLNFTFQFSIIFLIFN